jgi:hypothetical protein
MFRLIHLLRIDHNHTFKPLTSFAGYFYSTSIKHPMDNRLHRPPPYSSDGPSLKPINDISFAAFKVDASYARIWCLSI